MGPARAEIAGAGVDSRGCRTDSPGKTEDFSLLALGFCRGLRPGVSLGFVFMGRFILSPSLRPS